eukprot:TRINITY_DN7026_c0_g1_i1.p1 TRINITY_DN7026_c0_g1~~TRINITY_DN7026_c0_g1_i1.p1  ORF type:complete len:222 (-),score=59.85 TRINITY_DN7026_c0_g1_i1:141-806(-)
MSMNEIGSPAVGANTPSPFSLPSSSTPAAETPLAEMTASTPDFDPSTSTPTPTAAGDTNHSMNIGDPPGESPRGEGASEQVQQDPSPEEDDVIKIPPSIKALEDVEEKIAHSLEIASNAISELASLCSLDDFATSHSAAASRIDNFNSISARYLQNLREIQASLKEQIHNLKDCSMTPYHNSIYGTTKDFEISTMKVSLIHAHLASLRSFMRECQEKGSMS